MYKKALALLIVVSILILFPACAATTQSSQTVASTSTSASSTIETSASGTTIPSSQTQAITTATPSQTTGPATDRSSPAGTSGQSTSNPATGLTTGPTTTAPTKTTTANPVDAIINTNANIANYGLSLKRGDWIFYSADGIYKIKTDGTEKTKISGDFAWYLNSYGDWIYYTGPEGRIYRIKPDGSERTMICDSYAGCMMVAGDWIYYVDLTNVRSSADLKPIFKIKTDGTGKQKLLDQNVVSRINLSGDWIYYLKYSEFKLYKVKTDGTGSKKVSDTVMNHFNILGDSIYYDVSSGSARYDGIWKMKLTGTNAVRLTKNQVRSHNASGDWLYYSEIASPGLKKISLDGTRSMVVSNEDPAMLIMHINVFGDWIVYDSENISKPGTRLTIIKADGTDKRILSGD